MQRETADVWSHVFQFRACASGRAGCWRAGTGERESAPSEEAKSEGTDSNGELQITKKSLGALSGMTLQEEQRFLVLVADHVRQSSANTGKPCATASDYMTSLKISSLRRTFADYDQERRGFITYERFSEMLADFGHPLPESRLLEEIRGTLKPNKAFKEKGVLDFGEFLYLINFGQNRRRIGTGHDSFFQVLGNDIYTKLTKIRADRYMWFLLLLTFLVLIGTSTKLFHFYRCHAFPEISSNFLQKDYSISCLSSRYRVFEFYAGAMILVFPIGIPLLVRIHFAIFLPSFSL